MLRELAAPAVARAYGEVVRRLPIVSGLTSLSFNPVTNAVFSYCHGPLTAQMRNGVKVEIDPDEHDGRILYLFGTNDPKVSVVTQAFLRPGDCFLDIGANYSSIGLTAADKVGPSGAVHLFEPQPRLCDRLEAAIRGANATHVHLHRCGLLDKGGELELRVPPNHTGMATFVSEEAGDDWIVHKVPVLAIDEALPPLIDGRPFGVKVDVEGAEPFVMPWLVAQPRLKFLVFEGAKNQQTLFDIVKGAGLTLYGLCRLVFRRQVGRVDSVAGMQSYHDFVAVRVPEGRSAPERVSPEELARIVGA